MVTKKQIQYYLNLPWSYTIEQESYNDKHYYIIRVNELPGICTDAETVEEGMELIKEAIEGAIILYLKNGEKVPEPIKKDLYKGKIAYRTSKERHYNVAKLAKTMNKSISKTLDILIDTGLKYKGNDLRL
ncbi:MAG: type II toxin-antitoxin system HicB family antitoxin [Parachlamydiaceae bacterium]